MKFETRISFDICEYDYKYFSNEWNIFKFVTYVGLSINILGENILSGSSLET